MKSSTGKDENIITAGILTNIRSQKSKKGDMYARGMLEDMEGSVDMFVFPEAYRKLSEKVKWEIPVLVKAGVRIEEGSNPSLAVNEIYSLEDYKVPLPRSLRIRIPCRLLRTAPLTLSTRFLPSVKARPRCCSTWNARAISWL